MVKKRKLSKKSKQYYQKFLDGELSLPHSYWLVGVVYSFGVGIILGIFMLGFNLPERAANVLALPWLVFITIGIWKSATKYKGPKFWAILAKIAIVIGIINSVGSIISGV